MQRPTDRNEFAVLRDLKAEQVVWIVVSKRSWKPDRGA